MMTGYRDIKANKLNNTLRRQKHLRDKANAKGLRTNNKKELKRLKFVLFCVMFTLKSIA